MNISPDSAEKTVLQAQMASRVYAMDGQEIHALRGIDLEVRSGEFLAVTGPSGCGKSTLLHLLGGVDQPTSGRVLLLGRDTKALADRTLTRLRLTSVGFVFQRFFLIPMLTALENVMLPMMEAGVSKQEREQRAKELLGYVGLGERLGHRPSQLSGGEMQRVAIARALANQPSVLLADEPTGELDAQSGQGIGELLKKVSQEGTTIVLVTHNPELAALTGRVLKMRDGRFVVSEKVER
jgi:putative ABC transport system ATP-binding protein